MQFTKNSKRNIYLICLINLPTKLNYDKWIWTNTIQSCTLIFVYLLTPTYNFVTLFRCFSRAKIIQIRLLLKEWKIKWGEIPELRIVKYTYLIKMNKHNLF